MNKNIIRFIILLSIFIAFVYFIRIGPTKVPKSITNISVPAEGHIVVRGTMVCLPHKNTSGPQTMECAFGLRDESNRYYALRDSDPMYRNISSAPMNVLVEVEGDFTWTKDSKYQDIGVIQVSRLSVVK